MQRTNYPSKGKLHVNIFYSELTSLLQGDQESVTGYSARSETAPSSILDVRENISDCTGIVGLPQIVNDNNHQKYEPLSIAEFKVTLRNMESSCDNCGSYTHGTK